MKFYLNDRIYFEIKYDFDITKYINGDVEIIFFNDGNEIFSYETALKYFVEELIVILESLLMREDVTQYSSATDISQNYINFLKAESDTDFLNLQWKTFIDLSENGFMAFLFWEDSCFYCQVGKVDIIKKFVNSEYSELDYKNPVTIIKQKIEEEVLNTWLQKLKEIDKKIGSRIG